MKRIILSVLLAVAVAGTALAQEPAQPTQPARPRAQMSEEQRAKQQEHRDLFNIRMQIIKEELKLSDVQFEKFVPVYREYNKAKQFNHIKSPKIDMAKATKQQINNIMKIRLDNTINMAQVRKNYILIFENVITPRQVMKLYRVEDDLITRAREEYKNRQSK